MLQITHSLPNKNLFLNVDEKDGDTIGVIEHGLLGVALEYIEERLFYESFECERMILLVGFTGKSPSIICFFEDLVDRVCIEVVVVAVNELVLFTDKLGANLTFFDCKILVIFLLHGYL